MLALVGEYLIEDLARIPVEVEYASEFRYRNPILTEKDVVIAISQSGETADTLAALELAKSKGSTILGICNVVGSTISRTTDGGSYTHAGPEIGVASTKAFTSQVTVLSLLALSLGQKRGTIERSKFQRLLFGLNEIPSKIERALKTDDLVKVIAERFKDSSNFLYLGRGYCFPVALEGALKLKEISYIHAEGYPAAEMKHGPIALIDADMPVVVIATKGPSYEKVVSNIQEVKARKGVLIAIVSEGDTQVKEMADFTIEIPETDEIFSPLVASIPLQLLSYHIAVMRGCNVDQPRNLAKSVSQSSKVDRGYLTPYLLVEIEVISPKLWVLPLTSSQIEKYNFIKKKRDEGYYYYQISDMMNESNFKPQRTDKFTPQQVWGLEFKMEKTTKKIR